MSVIEIEDNVVFDGIFVFHKSFVNSYKGKTIIQTRRILKNYYTRSIQDKIIRYLKEKEIIKTEI